MSNARPRLDIKPEFYTVAEFAQILSISRGTVYNLLRDKTIQSVTLRASERACIRIPVSEVERLKAEAVPALALAT